ncbi:hypothetical protein [Pseudonocardia acidicola]|uniref:hypothetical protein n=1 Tax=Pseudonocardia acidicola TaxID=2724939 RepID=UPI001B7D1700|nr:hypothetical protein [Pseudonocardia acidicola]
MPRPVPFAEAIAAVRVEHRLLIDEVCAWSCDQAEPVDPDLLALVLAGVRPFEGDHDSLTLWTRVGVRGLLRCEIPNWCFRHRARWPEGVEIALRHFLDFLDGTGRFDEGSDPLWELRTPLICYAGPGLDGRPRPEGDRSPIPCECYLPYRESAEYLNEQMARGALVADVPTSGSRPDGWAEFEPEPPGPDRWPPDAVAGWDMPSGAAATRAGRRRGRRAGSGAAPRSSPPNRGRR